MLSSVEHIQATVSATTKERHALPGKCEENALKVQCMLGLANDARDLCARVAELKEASWVRKSEKKTEHRAVDMEVVAELALVERAEHTT